MCSFERFRTVCQSFWSMFLQHAARQLSLDGFERSAKVFGQCVCDILCGFERFQMVLNSVPKFLVNVSATFRAKIDVVGRVYTSVCQSF